MAKIINITCHKRKKDFNTEPYYCNTDIYTQEKLVDGYREHIARTVAMAICPRCGETNSQVCENVIFNDDIINLATRRYTR